MSNLRIKYIKYDNREGWMISCTAYVSNRDAKYRVLLDLNEMKYYIRNEYKKEFVVKSQAYGNLNVLKRNARKSLGKLGVAIGKEIRNRTFGRCQKGMTQQKYVKTKAKETNLSTVV